MALVWEIMLDHDLSIPGYVVVLQVVNTSLQHNGMGRTLTPLKQCIELLVVTLLSKYGMFLHTTISLYHDIL